MLHILSVSNHDRSSADCHLSFLKAYLRDKYQTRTRKLCVIKYFPTACKSLRTMGIIKTGGKRCGRIHPLPSIRTITSIYRTTRVHKDRTRSLHIILCFYSQKTKLVTGNNFYLATRLVKLKNILGPKRRKMNYGNSS